MLPYYMLKIFFCIRKTKNNFFTQHPLIQNPIFKLSLAVLCALILFLLGQYNAEWASKVNSMLVASLAPMAFIFSRRFLQPWVEEQIKQIVEQRNFVKKSSKKDSETAPMPGEKSSEESHREFEKIPHWKSNKETHKESGKKSGET